MEFNSIKLSENFVDLLIRLPENGMGYQLVKVILKSGKVLHRHKVLNSELLMLEEDETITTRDIDRIELEGLR